MRVRRRTFVPAVVKPSSPKLEVVDPKRVPRPTVYDPEYGCWVDDPSQKQCPECGQFFVPAPLASGKPSRDPTCSAKCGHRRSRRRVKERRVSTAMVALAKVDRAIEELENLRENIQWLLGDLGDV
jgi:hypothetical protein